MNTAIWRSPARLGPCQVTVDRSWQKQPEGGEPLLCPIVTLRKLDPRSAQRCSHPGVTQLVVSQCPAT